MHFNPTKDPHGGPKSTARHLGDKDGAPHEIMGKALVVHAMPDDYKTQPSGDSGARIACGVIR